MACFRLSARLMITKNSEQAVEDRITKLETYIAFQDDTLKQLNDVVANQQRQLDQLQNEVSRLKEQLASLRPSNIASEDEETPPPHY